MRVLSVGNSFAPQDFGGGYEAVWQSSVEYLESRDHAVRVLTTDHLVRDESLPEIADTHRELRWYWRDHGFPPRPLAECLSIERHNLAVFERQLDDFKPDVVSWWSMGGLTLSLLELARRRVLPAVAFVHDDWLDYGRRADAWHRRARRRRYPPVLLERLLGVPGRIRFGSAAHYAFVSDATRAHAIARGLELPDTSVVHSGIGAGLHAAPERAWEGRLLYVGRLDPRKGVSTAMEALAHLPSATLKVLGDGEPEYLAELRRLATSLGIEGRVNFGGAVPAEELPGAYAAADAVVFPVVWREPWGLVPLEAMASGRPVLATGRGGSAEYLVEGRNTLLFPAEDAMGLVAQVKRLAEDPKLRQTLREGGLLTAAGHSAARFNETVESVLRATLARGGPS